MGREREAIHSELIRAKPRSPGANASQRDIGTDAGGRRDGAQRGRYCHVGPPFHIGVHHAGKHSDHYGADRQNQVVSPATYAFDRTAEIVDKCGRFDRRGVEQQSDRLR